MLVGSSFEVAEHFIFHSGVLTVPGTYHMYGYESTPERGT